MSLSVDFLLGTLAFGVGAPLYMAAKKFWPKRWYLSLLMSISGVAIMLGFFVGLDSFVGKFLPETISAGVTASLGYYILNVVFYTALVFLAKAISPKAVDCYFNFA